MRASEPISLKSIQILHQSNKRLKVKRWVQILLVLLLGSLFLPWTQNIRSTGKVLSLQLSERPQQIHSPIPGRIEKWYVTEGDYLKKGDTILKISEIKTEYLDTSLIERTKIQGQAKRDMLRNYEKNIQAYDAQLSALQLSMQAKLKQLDIKVKQCEAKISSDESELVAAENDKNNLKDQLDRQQKMYDQGLVSITQLQQRNQAYQNSAAKKTMVENKLNQSRQELLSLGVERTAITQDYTEKSNKTSGERYKLFSMLAEGRGDLSKLENTISNYIIRNGMYILLAPQNGQFIQVKKAGIGELLKEGEPVAQIVPDPKIKAVEMYVRPMDLPLVHQGQKVRFTFDGYPAIVFSGWPKNSYGTFGGRIRTIEKNIQSNNLFRVLVIPDENEKPWPEHLSVGTGVQAITLLKNVRVWYELWRNMNGFPPDFYIQQNEKPEKSDEKK